jgi:hypothetical protein
MNEPDFHDEPLEPMRCPECDTPWQWIYAELREDGFRSHCRPCMASYRMAQDDLHERQQVFWNSFAKPPRRRR